MTEKELLNRALALLHPGQWFGFNSEEQNYSTLIVHDASITKPTEAEVNAKIQELKDAQQTAIDKKASGKQKLLDLGLTEEEVNAKIAELQQADADMTTKKASGKQKLRDLGLDDAEIKALIGV